MAVSFTIPFVYVTGVQDGLKWMAYYVYTPVHVGIFIVHIALTFCYLNGILYFCPDEELPLILKSIANGL